MQIDFGNSKRTTMEIGIAHFFYYENIPDHFISHVDSRRCWSSKVVGSWLRPPRSILQVSNAF